MSDPRNTLTHKLVLLGDTAVGKSCLAVRFVREEFLEFQEPTIGGAAPSRIAPRACCVTAPPPPPALPAAAFLTKNVTLEDVTIKFEIWDTAGQGACGLVGPPLPSLPPCLCAE